MHKSCSSGARAPQKNHSRKAMVLDVAIILLDRCATSLGIARKMPSHDPCILHNRIFAAYRECIFIKKVFRATKNRQEGTTQMNLDIMTLSFVLALAGVTQAGILAFQYRSDPDCPGIGWWALGSICTAGGFGLNLFRASPTWLPVVVLLGNALFVAAYLFYYQGTQRFWGLPDRSRPFYALAALYLLALTYYFFIEDRLFMRAVLISAVVAVLASVNARMLFRRQPRSRYDPQLLAAAAFAGMALIFLGRMIYLFLYQNSYAGFFSQTAIQLVLLISALAASTLWTVGFILMVNQRLQQKTDELRQRFEVLFQTNPDAALLTRLADGLIVEVNEGFSHLFGLQPAAVLGRTSVELSLWKNPADRRTMVDLLLRDQSCNNLEFSFTNKAGPDWVGIYSARIIYLEEAPYLISLIRDITLRKREEEKIRQSEALHRSILSASPDGVVITDLEGTIQMVSPKVVSLMSYEDESSLIGKNQLQFLVAEDRGRAIENLTLMFQDIFTGPGEYRIRDTAGRIVDVESNAEFVRDEQGRPQRMVFFVRDIRERKQIEAIMQRNSRVQMVLGKIAEEALRESSLPDFYARVHLWVEKILPADSFSIVLVDELTGDVKIPYIVGEKATLPAERKAGRGLTEYLLRLGGPLMLGAEDFRRLRESGEIDSQYDNIDHQWLGAPLSDLHGKVYGIVALNLHQPEKHFQSEDSGILAIIAAQISLAIDRKRLEENLERLAMTDELTGIANRRYFMQRVEDDLRRMQRYPAPASLLMMDIDHFKTVNDRYGHAMGDEVLRAVCRTGRSVLRDTDLIGRIGGEEFCLFLPQTTPAEAMQVAERLQQEIAALAFHSDVGGGFLVTVSVGVAGVKPDEGSLSDWLSRADGALYKAKAAGRNRVELAVTPAAVALPPPAAAG